MNDRNVNPPYPHICIILIHFLLSINLCTVSNLRYVPGQKITKIIIFCRDYPTSLFPIFLNTWVFSRHNFTYSILV